LRGETLRVPAFVPLIGRLSSFHTVANLALPSISQVQSSRGPVESWYGSQQTPRPAVSGERLPALTQIQSHGASSASSSPRGGSGGSYSSSVYNGSVSSATSYTPSVNGQHTFKTPSPESTPQSYGREGGQLHDHQSPPFGQQGVSGIGFGVEYQNSMNQIGAYNPNDVHQSNMATAHAHPPTSGPGLGGHYTSYPPMLSTGHPGYPATTYSSYAYPAAYSGTPVTSSMSNIAHPPPLTTMQSAPTAALPGTQNYVGHAMDTTGQIAPPGVKPRVTATLWEDEGTLCFQVEAKGVCVARREDNHMINGTKLLNVAGMTRGRRDGILKSEKVRHVVKIGPMHLKGVWIPFDRALDFANKEKITEHLYPLFVHDIGALLYHPNNPTGGRQGPVGNTQSALAAYERRRTEQQRMIGASPQTPGQAPAMHQGMVPTSNQGPARPDTLGRANTFPTPPTSASSVVGVNAQGSPYENWNNVQSMPQNQALSIDTHIGNRGSVPNTPASTPPGKATHGTTPYSASQSYEGARPVYSNPATSGPYQSQPVRFGGPLQPPTYAPKDEKHDESEYAHPSGPYGANQNSYAYNPNHGTDPHSSPQQNGSGRATPRTAAAQPTWHAGYGPPPRSNTAPASNLYSVMEPRDGPNGTPNGAAPPPAYYPASNGNLKRGRDAEDDEHEDAKRHKAEAEDGGPVGGSPYPAINSSRPTIPARKVR
jgi:protein SOK2